MRIVSIVKSLIQKDQMPLLMVLFILRTGCAPADNLEDLEAAQFPNPFQLKRSINNIVARVYGHSPSTFEKLTAFPRELGLTKRGDQYLLVLRDT